MNLALQAYLPQDRRHALARSTPLPDRAEGAALFADLTGYTPLTEALARAFGPRRGAEELLHQLDRLYDAVIDPVEAHRGSVIGFAGDAITCWFDNTHGGNAVTRATVCALLMQQAVAALPAFILPDGHTMRLALKVAVTAGPVRRFQAGDPALQYWDILAGATVARLAVAEQLACRNEIILDEAAIARLGTAVLVHGWRTAPEQGATFAVVEGLQEPVAPTPWPPLAPLPDEALRPWMPPAVYERLRRGQGDFLPELRPAVALFVRFAGWHYDADDEAGIKLDRYIRWVQRTIHALDGTLLQVTIGDKGSYLYIAFGAPTAHEDDARRAAVAALALRSPPPEVAPPGAVQFGLTQGIMRTGASGSQSCRTYSVLGDQVNLAARLMQHAAPGQILATSSVMQATGHHFAWLSHPAITVKGKTQPVALWELQGAHQHSPATRHEPTPTSPMVGRVAEMALIEARLAQAAGGQGQVVAITAEAGIGKSRLVAEILRLARARGIRCAVGAAHSYATDAPYLIWQPLWRTLLDLPADALPEAEIDVLHRVLGAIDPALLPRLPLLGAVLDLPIPDSPLTRTFDPTLRQRSCEALLVACLRALARQQPLLLVLEDIHWADTLSHDLLAAIARAAATLPVLLVLAARPMGDGDREPTAPALSLPHTTELRLSEFTLEESEEMVRRRFTATPPPPEVVAHLTQRAQGNPFYLEELLNYCRDQGIDLHNPRALASLDLPTSLHSLILSRIDQLNEQQKITIKVASIIGRVFLAAWLYGYYPALGTPEEVKALLLSLHRLDLLPLERAEPELTYLFKHIITQEVAYESLAYSTRAALHEQFARFLEEMMGAAGSPPLDLLAFHYERSENLPKKREALRRAGDAAEARYAHETARGYYERLLPLLPEAEHAEIRLKLGTLLKWMGAWDAAERHLHAAVRLAAAHSDRSLEAASSIMLGQLYYNRGAKTEALAALHHARAILEAQNDRAAMLEVYEWLGHIASIFHDQQTALHYYEVWRSSALAQQNEASAYEALAALGTVYIHMDQIDRSLACYQAWARYAEATGNPVFIARAAGRLGTVYLELNDFPAALTAWLQALDTLQEIGHRQALLHTMIRISQIYLAQGEWETTQSCCYAGIEETLSMGDYPALNVALALLAESSHGRGALDEAAAWGERAVALGRTLSHAYLSSYLLALALIYTDQQRPAAALRLAEEALQICETGNYRLHEFDLRLFVVRLHRQEGLASPGDTITALAALREQWQEPTHHAEIWYEQWCLDPTDEMAREHATTLYRQFYERGGDLRTRQRYATLTGMALPPALPLPVLPPFLTAPTDPPAALLTRVDAVIAHLQQRTPA